MKRLVLILLPAIALCIATYAQKFSPEELSAESAETLVQRAIKAKQLPQLLETAEELFFNPASESYDESRMAEILRAALAAGKLKPDDVSTAEWMLHDVCEVNAPDSLAANIKLELPSQDYVMLHDYLPGKPIVLFFYDPTCRHCRSIMNQLTELAAMIDVLAVCIDAPHKLWIETRDGLNPGWVSAFDMTKVTETDDYVIRGLPGIYLLDANRKVILKNPTPQKLLSTLKGGHE